MSRHAGNAALPLTGEPCAGDDKGPASELLALARVPGLPHQHSPSSLPVPCGQPRVTSWQQSLQSNPPQSSSNRCIPTREKVDTALLLAACPANGQGSGKGRQPEINTQPRPQQEKDAWNWPLECLYKLLPASTPKGGWRGTARPQRRRGHPQSGTNHSGTAKHAQPLLCRLLLLLPNAQPISTRLPLPRHDCKRRHAVERQRACKAEGCEQARCPLPSRPGTLCTRCPRGTAHIAAGPAAGMPPGSQAAGVHVSHRPAAAAWGEQRVAGCSSAVADAAKWRIRLRRGRSGCNVGQQE